MSTQTGIKSNEKLKEYFATCLNTATQKKYRMLKIVIKDEELTLDDAKETAGSWERDWDPMVLNSVHLQEPCYLLYRFDKATSESDVRWILISWCPETSSVRNKMLYASTKATLKREFGSNMITDDLYGNIRDDISLAGYRKHKDTAAAPVPLTRDEEEREEVNALNAQSDVSVTTKHNTISGLAFPLTGKATDAIGAFKDERFDYVQLCIDVDKEIIDVIKTDSISVDDLKKNVPQNVPRYHIFRFTHIFEGEQLKASTFIYSMPGYNCSIKERMLYSSCLNAVVDLISNQGVQVVKKMEIDSGEELTEKYLYDEIHPQKAETKANFSRPAAPGRRPRGRQTKAQT